VEQLVRLPGCFLCYTPAQDAPPVAPTPAAEAGFITFGSFNALAKITPQVLAVWARILQR
jgi:predicted O-linked N-acetylglucosamine transferase (SPINDLY family)